MSDTLPESRCPDNPDAIFRELAKQATQKAGWPPGVPGRRTYGCNGLSPDAEQTALGDGAGRWLPR
jgi:hypothetical protein